jgi:subtilisin-like proprotein convertase family protein
VHVTHTYDRDLRMTLTGPDGASVLLTDRRGGNGDNYGTNCTSGRTVFDDAAPTPIAAGTAPFALGFKPEGPLSTFAGKSGAAANGTWTLTVSDHEGLDVGTLQCWTLEVVPSACTAGGGACGGGPPQVSLEFSSASVGGGNGNGVVDPDECNDLTVGVRNAGSSTATGVSGVLSSSTPGVSISQATSAYPDIPASAIRTNAAAFKVQTSSAFACGTNIQLSLALTTGNAGSFTLPFALASGGSTTPLVRSSTDTPKAIPDLGSTESVIEVSGFGGQVAKVVAKVHLTHTYDRDLRLSLVGPGGTSVLLADRRGGNGDGYGTSCSSLTVFDDAAATPIGSGTAPFAGSFRPEQPLSVFTGMTTNVNGNWRLHVSDNEGLDVGTIQCWTLEVTPQGCTPGGGGCP